MSVEGSSVASSNPARYRTLSLRVWTIRLFLRLTPWCVENETHFPVSLLKLRRHLRRVNAILVRDAHHLGLERGVAHLVIELVIAGRTCVAHIELALAGLVAGGLDPVRHKLLPARVLAVPLHRFLVRLAFGDGAPRHVGQHARAVADVGIGDGYGLVRLEPGGTFPS